MRTKKGQKAPEEKPSLVKRAPDILVGSMLGALGASIVTGMLAAPQKFYEWVTRPPEFPPQAIMLSLAPDCGKGNWEKVQGVEGRFLVGAGAGQKPGEPTAGRTKVKLKPENMPSMGVAVGAMWKKGSLGWGEGAYVADLMGGEGNKQEIARVGRYNNEEVDITPPGIALTLCHRKG